MPWMRATEVLERTRFVLDAEKGLWGFSELCEIYGVSRKTGYKWLRRYEAGGLEGLKDHSRRPHHLARATDATVVDLLLALRDQRPTWGPMKLLAQLARKHPGLALPARSTVADWLHQRGLARPGRRRRHAVRTGVGLGGAEAPNDLWTADYKGDFRLGDGRRCYPLTVADAYSRFFLACRTRRSVRGEAARPVFEEVFREFGLPNRIGTDNGSPFASTGLAGLTKLSAWWIKLGIQLVRIQPGHPEQNGRHERMHKTLKAEAVIRRPPAPDEATQQAAFDRFREEYNGDRPHQALHGLYPADVYEPSKRSYVPGHTPGLDYPAGYERRQVHVHGYIRWRGGTFFLTEALEGEPVAVTPIDNDTWAVYFGRVLLGSIRQGEKRLRPAEAPFGCGASAETAPAGAVSAGRS